MPLPPRPTESDPFSTRAGTLLILLTSLIASCVAVWMEEHLPGVRLNPLELLALILSIITFGFVMGVKWRYGWQPSEAAQRGHGPAPAASHFTSSPPGPGLPSR